jgi:hypothetical protein
MKENNNKANEAWKVQPVSQCKSDMFHVAVREGRKFNVWSTLKIDGDYETANTSKSIQIINTSQKSANIYTLQQLSKSGYRNGT